MGKFRVKTNVFFFFRFTNLVHPVQMPSRPRYVLSFDTVGPIEKSQRIWPNWFKKKKDLSAEAVEQIQHHAVNGDFDTILVVTSSWEIVFLHRSQPPCC